MGGTSVVTHAAIVYLIASAVYAATTSSLDASFDDSLTIEQRRLQALSAGRKRMHFLRGIGIGLVVVSVWRPGLSTEAIV